MKHKLLLMIGIVLLMASLVGCQPAQPPAVEEAPAAEEAAPTEAAAAEATGQPKPQHPPVNRCISPWLVR